jgi:hypothetical protein
MQTSQFGFTFTIGVVNASGNPPLTLATNSGAGSGFGIINQVQITQVS